MAEVTDLRAEDQHQKQEKARETGYVQKGGSMTVGDNQESI